MNVLSDIRIKSSTRLPSPDELRAVVNKTEEQRAFIAKSRDEIKEIIFGNDKRLIVVVGPCSIHDAKAGLEYANKLKALSDELEDKLLFVMRVYFEKPRTSLGWKGLIMDPYLNGTCDIPEGLKQARHFLNDVTALGIRTATEFLDPITPQYIADYISWAAIGARTTESQTHRQMASGLSMPIGFKNSTGGDVVAAANAILAAGGEQTFLGITQSGEASAVTTLGNPSCHTILRGGLTGPNFEAAAVDAATAILEKKNLKPALMVDCSHDNSGKDPERQPEVFHSVLDQLKAGNDSIIGVMLESNLGGGSQKFPCPIDELKYGVSITDGCLAWNKTEKLLRFAHEALSND